MKLAKGQWLFKEGDISHSMYLIKSGRLAIVKYNPSTTEEVILSERINGQLIGEMSFFDNKPRSAGVKSMTPAEVIELPFATLQEQFERVPPWLKVMVKTINNQLREASIRIRNLENIASDTKDKLLPHTLLRICTMISLVALRAEESTEEGPIIPYKDLYFYATSIFHQPPHKLNKVLKSLQKLNLLQIDEDDENQSVILLEHETLDAFTRWYHNFLSLEQSKQVYVEEKELSTFQAVIYYGQDVEADENGFVKVNLDHVKENSQDELELKFNMNHLDAMATKGLFKDRTVEDGVPVTSFNFEALAPLATYWNIIHATQQSGPAE